MEWRGKETKHIIMGLDMYLYRVPKVASLDELAIINSRLDVAYLNNTLQDELKAICKENSYIYDIDFSVERYVDIDKYKADKSGWGNLINLEIRVAYWRKFNALHQWMVNNVQGGVDDCGDYIVTTEHLKALQTALNAINKDNVEDILPTSDGFFFGGQEYDDWYWNSVENLKAVITYLLTQKLSDTTFVYHSSW